MTHLANSVIAVIGLGYVGLPLAAEFGKQRPVIGFDINTRRIYELQHGFDRTLELSSSALAESRLLTFSADSTSLTDADIYIITTPTPVDRYNRPDLGPVLAATRSVAAHLKPGNVVIYESTVYPGATEEDCVPVLEKLSGLALNRDFFVGYSPERINPGDKQHRLPEIVKITSGSTPEAADLIDKLYSSIITAGTHRAPSIRVAEAAKVIENTQRDVNIALVNELSLLFSRLGIDTEEVLTASGTKWNFLPFRPGLVGGHCIGVDPYYLTHKAKEVGYHPQIILAGRRLNDSMGSFIVARLVKKMTQSGIPVAGSRILVLGLTFKENTPDTRNSKVVDVVRELIEYGVDVDVVDPWVDAEEAAIDLGIRVVKVPDEQAYDAIILAVAHQVFADSGVARIRAYGKPTTHVLFDLKYVLGRDDSDLRL